MGFDFQGCGSEDTTTACGTALPKEEVGIDGVTVPTKQSRNWDAQPRSSGCPSTSHFPSRKETVALSGAQCVSALKTPSPFARIFPLTAKTTPPAPVSPTGHHTAVHSVVLYQRGFGGVRTLSFSFFMSIKNKHAEKLPLRLFIKPQTMCSPHGCGIDGSNQRDL